MTIFYLPDLGEGLAEAEIREWYVNVGDEVTVDQPLVSMETAKAIVDVPSPHAGKITELHGKVNDVIKTGAPLISYQSDKGSVVGKLETSEKAWDDREVVVGTVKTIAKTSTKNLKAMPAARVLAKELNVDLANITPTGPQGLITVEDVKQALSSPSTHTETLHGVRRIMAQAMTQSHHDIVPVTIFEDADITHFPKSKDISVALVRAIIVAAKAEPTLNAWFNGGTLERQLFDHVNVGLAVDSKAGLFVPVIKSAEDKTEDELRQMINQLKAAVVDRNLAPADMQGATITLSNFGMIAGRYATPVIVPPMVAIIATGRSRDVPLVQHGKVVVGRIMPLSLTFDHRAVTGGEATRFLGAMLKSLEDLNN